LTQPYRGIFSKIFFWYFDKNFIDIFSIIFDDSNLITVFLKKRDKIFNGIFKS